MKTFFLALCLPGPSVYLGSLSGMEAFLLIPFSACMGVQLKASLGSRKATWEGGGLGSGADHVRAPTVCVGPARGESAVI